MIRKALKSAQLLQVDPNTELLMSSRPIKRAKSIAERRLVFRLHIVNYDIHNKEITVHNPRKFCLFTTNSV